MADWIAEPVGATPGVAGPSAGKEDRVDDVDDAVVSDDIGLRHGRAVDVYAVGRVAERNQTFGRQSARREGLAVQLT